MIEVWFKGFLAGMFFVMTCVLSHVLISERIKRRKERQFLETYGRVLNILPIPGESTDELRMRLREAMHHPSCRSMPDPDMDWR